MGHSLVRLVWLGEKSGHGANDFVSQWGNACYKVVTSVYTHPDITVGWLLEFEVLATSKPGYEYTHNVYNVNAV